MTKHTFSIDSDFMLDNKHYKIISGAIHYFRVVPEYWRDRLEKLKAMGCNTVETYVAWNVHEPQKGQFNFEGINDLTGFLDIAKELGLWAIVRPGPYICGEWELGGLPPWLLSEDSRELRSHGPFMSHLEDYWKMLIPKLVSRQIDNGGNIIMMQVENEYGYYSDDMTYIEAVKNLMLKYGVSVPLVTSDGPDNDSLECGSLPGVLPTANFGSRPEEQLPKLERQFVKMGQKWPKMVMEFWVGWFDAWGDSEHNTTAPEENAKVLDEILRQGSVNFYMFHGGTNFGFMNGSNFYVEQTKRVTTGFTHGFNSYGKLTPDTTSYDYDAPLSEDGRITEKYKLLKQVIGKYTTIPDVHFSTKISFKAFDKANVLRKVSLFNTLDKISSPINSLSPKPMEKLGQGYGYTLYRASVCKGERIDTFALLNTADRAQVFVNSKKELTLYDRELLEGYKVDWTINNNLHLDILTENMGRVNYGPLLDNQRKGIAGGVMINGHRHSGWEQYTLPLDRESIENIDFDAGYEPGLPAFYEIEFHIDEPADTFLNMDGWGKGFVLINGFQLGRFWEIGPQGRLYIPAPLLKVGDNKLIIFETEGTALEYVTFSENNGF